MSSELAAALCARRRAWLTTNIRANAGRIGLDRDIGAFDVSLQVMSLMQGRDTGDLGVAMFIGAVIGAGGAPESGSESESDVNLRNLKRAVEMPAGGERWKAKRRASHRSHAALGI